MKKLIMIAFALVLFLSACNTSASTLNKSPMCITQYSGGKIVNQYDTVFGNLYFNTGEVGLFSEGVSLYGDIKVESGHCK